MTCPRPPRSGATDEEVVTGDMRRCYQSVRWRGMADEGRLARESALVVRDVPYTPLHDSTPEPSPPLRNDVRSIRVDESMINCITAEGSALTAVEQ
jgi:hypothetical protein